VIPRINDVNERTCCDALLLGGSKNHEVGKSGDCHVVLILLTKDGIYKVLTIPNGAGFLPSTV